MRSAAYINSKLTSPYLSLKYYTIDDVFNILHALKVIFHKTKMFPDYYGTIIAFILHIKLAPPSYFLISSQKALIRLCFLLIISFIKKCKMIHIILPIEFYIPYTVYYLYHTHKEKNGNKIMYPTFRLQKCAKIKINERK